MGRRKKTVQENDVKTDISELEFLINILDKQFELAGIKYNTKQLLEMSPENQSEIFSQYTLTEDQYTQWFEYFINIAHKTDIFKSLDDAALTSVFEDISNEWGLTIIEDQEVESDEVDDNEDE
jgi:hypothetical protein